MRRTIGLTSLLAALTLCASGEPVPPWMQAILDSRPQLKTLKGAHVHRSQYPEDRALKAAGALLARPPVRNPVVVAMTTTPTRVAACDVRKPRQFRDDIVQRRPSGGSGRASPRSSPARRAAALPKRCSCGTPTASRTAPCASGTQPTAGASSRRSAGGRAEAWGILACSGISRHTIKRTLHND